MGPQAHNCPGRLSADFHLLQSEQLRLSSDCQEFWKVCDDVSWKMNQEMYDHLRALSSVLLSAKETLEDCIGDVTDHRTRDSKTNRIRPERLHSYYSQSERLKRAPVTWVDACKGNQPDFLDAGARSFSRASNKVFGFGAPVTQEVPQIMKDLCRAGMGSWFVSL